MVYDGPSRGRVMDPVCGGGPINRGRRWRGCATVTRPNHPMCWGGSMMDDMVVPRPPVVVVASAIGAVPAVIAGPVGVVVVHVCAVLVVA